MYDYSTVENIKAALPSIGSLSNLSSATIADLFLQPAEAQVNGKLSRLYSVPVPGRPPMLETITRSIATYWLMARRIYPAERATRSDWVDRFKEAQDTLDEIAKGELPLVTASGTVVSMLSGATSAGVPYSNTMDYTPTFADDASEFNAEIDPSKVDDIDASRA